MPHTKIIFAFIFTLSFFGCDSTPPPIVEDVCPVPINASNAPVFRDGKEWGNHDLTMKLSDKTRTLTVEGIKSYKDCTSEQITISISNFKWNTGKYVLQGLIPEPVPNRITYSQYHPFDGIVFAYQSDDTLPNYFEVTKADSVQKIISGKFEINLITDTKPLQFMAPQFENISVTQN